MLAPTANYQSTVYGLIKDTVSVEPNAETKERLIVNRRAVQELPEFNACTLLYRDMFSLPSASINAGGFYSATLHFGAPYDRVEYEWEQWLEVFEELLQKMFWESATVHLETAVSGTHTYIWEATESSHSPQSGAYEMRCEWIKDNGFYQHLTYTD
ncbi:MAG: hypothetical protein ACR2PS_12730 [Pseudomonadales bacterium]